MKKFILIISFTFFLSCSISNKFQANKNLCENDTENYISVKSIEINKDLKEIILEAKKNFAKKINKKPDYIIIKLAKSESNPMILIDVKNYLYNNKMDRKIFKNNFVYGHVLDDTLVLIEGEDNYEYFKNYLALTDEKLCVKIIYSEYTDVYYHTYELKDKFFILKESQCTCDLP